jgi:hypothetical protein
MDLSKYPRTDQERWAFKRAPTVLAQQQVEFNRDESRRVPKEKGSFQAEPASIYSGLAKLAGVVVADHQAQVAAKHQE